MKKLYLTFIYVLFLFFMIAFIHGFQYKNHQLKAEVEWLWAETYNLSNTIEEVDRKSQFVQAGTKDIDNKDYKLRKKEGQKILVSKVREFYYLYDRQKAMGGDTGKVDKIYETLSKRRMVKEHLLDEAIGFLSRLKDGPTPLRVDEETYVNEVKTSHNVFKVDRGKKIKTLSTKEVVLQPKLRETTLNDLFGGSMASADLNKDGFDDIIVGAPFHNYYYNDKRYNGAVYIFLGSKDFDSQVDLILRGEEAKSAFGSSVDRAGDINGDGFVDLVVGVPRDHIDGIAKGEAFIFFGGRELDAKPDIHLLPTESQDGLHFGNRVLGGFDFNGDGKDDLVIGAGRWATSRTEPNGIAYVFFGPIISSEPKPSLILKEKNTGASYSYKMTGGDVNGDGFDDLVITAPQKKNPSEMNTTGAVYVYFGGPSFDNVADVVLHGYGTKAPSDGFGTAVSVMGDVNGDGFNDLLVGARYDTVSPGMFGKTVLNDNGKAYLFFGGKSFNKKQKADLVFIGEHTEDLFGLEVSGPGDINGDGYSDFIVAGPRWESEEIRQDDEKGRSRKGGSYNYGAIYVYFGGKDLDGDVDLIYYGNIYRGVVGIGLCSTIADVNGDGLKEIIFSGTGWFDARFATEPKGRAYVLWLEKGRKDE